MCSRSVAIRFKAVLSRTTCKRKTGSVKSLGGSLRKGSPGYVSKGTELPSAGPERRSLAKPSTAGGRHLKPQADSSVERNRHCQWKLFPPVLAVLPSALPKSTHCLWASTSWQPSAPAALAQLSCPAMCRGTSGVLVRA